MVLISGWMEEEFVTVHRTRDPLAAEMLVDLLRQDGVAARFVGSQHGALFGAAQLILEGRIEVPAGQAGQAIDVLEAYLSDPARAAPDAGAETGAEAGGPGADGEDDVDDAPGPPRLSRVLAAGVVPLLFGGSHFYSRRAWTGAVIAAGQLVAVWTMATGRSGEAIAATVVFGGLLAFDLVGGQLAVGAWNRAVRPSGLRQLAVGAAALFGLGAIGVTAAPYLARWKLPPRAADAGERRPSDDDELRDRAARPGDLPVAPLHFDVTGEDQRRSARP